MIGDECVAPRARKLVAGIERHRVGRPVRPPFPRRRRRFRRQLHNPRLVHEFIAHDPRLDDERMAVEPALNVMVHLFRRIEVGDRLTLVGFPLQHAAEPVAAVVHPPDLVGPRPDHQLLGIAQARGEQPFIAPVQRIGPDLLPLAVARILDVARVADARVDAPVVNQQRAPPVPAPVGRQHFVAQHLHGFIRRAVAVGVAGAQHRPRLRKPQPALHPLHRVNGAVPLHECRSLLIHPVTVRIAQRHDVPRTGPADVERPVRIERKEPRAGELVDRHADRVSLAHLHPRGIGLRVAPAGQTGDHEGGRDAPD
ncbi:MAG: hypothetical protein BWZ08_01146 [candidate division BRC1 bacterium ADurb.BinA292]|nr:MAG: hypothetical protein BWZ08_01146 [candidate division BRC1 bacterium ADurb.BinA292]